MHCLSENVSADIEYVVAVRQICDLACAPHRAVGFIERQMPRADITETLLRERMGDTAYERHIREMMRNSEGLI